MAAYDDLVKKCASLRSYNKMGDKHFTLHHSEWDEIFALHTFSYTYLFPFGIDVLHFEIQILSSFLVIFEQTVFDSQRVSFSWFFCITSQNGFSLCVSVNGNTTDLFEYFVAFRCVRMFDRLQLCRRRFQQSFYKSSSQRQCLNPIIF